MYSDACFIRAMYAVYKAPSAMRHHTVHENQIYSNLFYLMCASVHLSVLAYCALFTVVIVCKICALSVVHSILSQKL
jgi:hypothetical protein